MRFQTFAPPPQYVDTEEKIEACIKHCLNPDILLGVDTETLGLVKNEDGTKRYNMTDEVVVMGLSPDKDTRYLVPRRYLHRFKPVLEANTTKALANAKFDAHRIMNSCGAWIHGRWADTVHMDFLIDEDTRENKHGLKDCVQDYFGFPMIDYKTLFGSTDPRHIVPGHALWEKYLDYATLDPWCTRLLAILQLEKLKEIKAWEADDNNPAYTYDQMYWDTEELQIKTLFRMERRGIHVDRESLVAIGQKLTVRMDELAKEINALVGYPINPNSTQQLGEFFFQKEAVYNLPTGPMKKEKYTPLSFTEKTRAPQVDDVLFKHLALGKIQDPVAKLVMEYKECSKLNGTYVEGLLRFLYKDGRIHTSYSTTKTTGRLGSTEPNLQNIPRPDTDPHGIRGAFRPEEGNVFIIADYSQLEMRILADMSGDETMIQAICDGMDMHSFTASKVLNKTYDEFVVAVKAKEKWAKDARTAFKKTGFGIVYGITKMALSEQLSLELGRYVSPDEAQGYINQYLGTFPGVRDYIQRMHAMARSLGYVQTMCGRLRRLSKAKYGRGGERGHAERQAQNAPIQGSAADIVKRAMIMIEADQRLTDIGWKLLHQVHDELILEGPETSAEEALELVKYYMENPINPPLAVPLTAEPKIASSWLEK